MIPELKIRCFSLDFLTLLVVHGMSLKIPREIYTMSKNLYSFSRKIDRDADKLNFNNEFFIRVDFSFTKMAREIKSPGFQSKILH